MNAYISGIHWAYYHFLFQFHLFSHFRFFLQYPSDFLFHYHHNHCNSRWIRGDLKKHMSRPFCVAPSLYGLLESHPSTRVAFQKWPPKCYCWTSKEKVCKPDYNNNTNVHGFIVQKSWVVSLISCMNITCCTDTVLAFIILHSFAEWVLLWFY